MKTAMRPILTYIVETSQPQEEDEEDLLPCRYLQVGFEPELSLALSLQLFLIVSSKIGYF